MHEAPRDEQPDNAARDPEEQLGDIYTVDIDDGTVSNIEKQRPRPTVWVGSWLDYNSGALHGEWIHADQKDDVIAAQISALLARSPTARATGDLHIVPDGTGAVFIFAAR